MRARTVNEVQDFERGQDPKSSLGIGIKAKIQEAVPEIKKRDSNGWSCMNDDAWYEPVKGELRMYTYPGDDCSEYFEGMLDDLGIGEFFNLSYADETEYEFTLKPEFQGMNEAQNFERGANPKKTMGIGGLDLAKDYKDRIEEYKMAVSGTTLSHTDEWKEFLKDTLIGKTITAEMKKLPVIGKSGKTETKFVNGEFTIQIQDVIPTWGVGEDFSITTGGSPMGSIDPKLIVADMDNNMYEMSLSQKLYFD